MKSVIKSVTFILATALMSNSAQAADGTIYIQGNLFLQTCTISVGGVVSPAIATVKLPTISSSLLNAPGKVAGRTNFQIELSNCTGNAATAVAYFESGVDVESISGQLINRGTASNVRLQLLGNYGASGNQVIKVGNQEQLKEANRVAITAGKAVLPYAVEYRSIGIAGAGTVLSSVTYSIDYL